MGTCKKCNSVGKGEICQSGRPEKRKYLFSPGAHLSVASGVRDGFYLSKVWDES
jgi:hypothetical protein